MGALSSNVRTFMRNDVVEYRKMLQFFLLSESVFYIKTDYFLIEQLNYTEIRSVRILGQLLKSFRVEQLCNCLSLHLVCFRNQI